MTRRNDTEGAALAAPLFSKLAGGLVWLCGALSTLLILVAFIITLYAVFMRYVVNAPLLWSDEITGWCLVALVMLGVAEAYRRGDHIAIDLVTSKLRGTARKAQLLFADAAVLVLAGVLFLSAWEAIHFARDFGSYTSGNIEIEAWIPQAPMLPGAALLGLVAITRMIETLAGHRT